MTGHSRDDSCGQDGTGVSRTGGGEWTLGGEAESLLMKSEALQKRFAGLPNGKFADLGGAL